MRPYEITMNNLHYALFPDGEEQEAYEEAHPKTAKVLGIIVCQMYFQEPDLDKATFFLNNNERLTFYDQREYIIWLGGIALNSEDERILRLAHRNQPSFDAMHGWRPRTIVNWLPSDKDLDDYSAFQSVKAEEEWKRWNDEED